MRSLSSKEALVAVSLGASRTGVIPPRVARSWPAPAEWCHRHRS
jgi:hypothetical protein